jgi:hypothetical protein
MQIIIDIPKHYYENIKKELPICLTEEQVVTILPRGHGRLIDAGEYVDVLNNAQIEGLNTYEGLGRAKELLIEAHTIIEADKESEDE